MRKKGTLKKSTHFETKNKRFTLIVVAEGAELPAGGCVTLESQQSDRQTRLGGIGMLVAAEIEQRLRRETRTVVLGHLQRGGSPSLRDRTMASLMGVRAIECINEGRLNRLIVLKDGQIGDVDIEEGLKMTKSISEKELARAKLLS